MRGWKVRLDIPAVPQQYERGYLQRMFTAIQDRVNAVLDGRVNRGKPPTKTADFTVTADISSYIVNGGASVTVTLPAAANFPGREISLRTIAAFTVVSASSNVVPLAGGAAGTAILAATAGKWARLISDGSAWQIMEAN